jgi:putative tricarboxylic transport membrane protein
MHRIGGAITLVLGILALVYSYTLSLGSLSNPAPGLWPFVISGVIVGCSIMLLITERDGRDHERFTSGVRRIIFGVISLSIFIMLFEWFGFAIPGLLTFVFWLRFIGNESWRSTLTISVLATAAFYVVFVLLLGVPFPRGVF